MRPLALALLLLVSASRTFAWGGLGHRAIGELAQRNLCADAEKAAAALLDGQSLADVATWADDVRSDARYSTFKPWHFVTMPLGSTYATPGAHGDLVTALAAQTGRLAAVAHSENRAARAEALRLVIHFVGDAHQPLHAGEHSDYGGNAVAVTWFGIDTNLHHVWDGEFFYRLGLKYPELVDQLIAEHKTSGSFEQLTPIDWVNASSARAKTIYPSSPHLSEAYYAKNLPLVKEQIWLAGMRLAALLNRTLGCSNLDAARPSPLLIKE